MVNSLGSFFMAPHKGSSCLWLFPYPLYDKFKKTIATSLLLQVPQIMKREHTWFPLTFVYSLALSPLAFHEIPTHRGILVQKGVSQIHSRVSDVYFSNNISILQV